MTDRFNIEQVIRILGLEIRVDQADEGRDFDVACRIALEKLMKCKEYEDLEEQGRLIKLPCKVGDTVYRITDGMIQEFEINKFVVSYSIFNNEATVYMYFAGGHGGCSIDFYGVSVFGTQTEAEAKLKELRGEQNDGE